MYTLIYFIQFNAMQTQFSLTDFVTYQELYHLDSPNKPPPTVKTTTAAKHKPFNPNKPKLENKGMK